MEENEVMELDPSIESEYTEQAEDKDTTQADSAPEADACADDDAELEALITRDVEELHREFPELRGIRDITQLHNPMRYASLRDLGLTPAEAYLATRKRVRPADTRSHLAGAVARAASAPRSAMSRRELERARELFSGLSDSEIQSLYKRVMK